MEENKNCDQNIIIEGRKRMSVSGVRDVISFDDETLLLDTTLGRITVKGEALHIVGFNNETGEFSAEGKIHAAVYMSDGKSSGGIVSRFFR